MDKKCSRSVYLTKAEPSERHDLVPNYGSKLCRWGANSCVQASKSTDVTFVADAGFFPLRTSYYTLDPTINDGSLASLSQCDTSSLLYAKTEGFSFSFASYTTQWLRDDPRLAVEAGIDIHLDVLHGGDSWFYKTEYPSIAELSNAVATGELPKSTQVTPSYSVSFRPQTGASFGFRHALDPGSMNHLWGKRAPWGADDLSGISKLTRHEWGMRGGFLIGPGYGGLEYTLVGDIFLAHSIRSNKSDWANFTPYHPIFLGGLFARYQYGNLLEPRKKKRLLELLWQPHFYCWLENSIIAYVKNDQSDQDGSKQIRQY